MLIPKCHNACLLSVLICSLFCSGYGFLTSHVYNATFANAFYITTVTCGRPLDTFNLSCVLPAWETNETDTEVTLRRMLPAMMNTSVDVHGSIPFKFFQQVGQVVPSSAGAGSCWPLLYLSFFVPGKVCAQVLVWLTFDVLFEA
jgi:hypothetical protein